MGSKSVWGKVLNALPFFKSSPNPMPTKDDFQKACRQLGIHPDRWEWLKRRISSRPLTEQEAMYLLDISQEDLDLLRLNLSPVAKGVAKAVNTYGKESYVARQVTNKMAYEQLNLEPGELAEYREWLKKDEEEKLRELLQIAVDKNPAWKTRSEDDHLIEIESAIKALRVGNLTRKQKNALIIRIIVASAFMSEMNNKKRIKDVA